MGQIIIRDGIFNVNTARKPLKNIIVHGHAGLVYLVNAIVTAIGNQGIIIYLSAGLVGELNTSPRISFE